MYHENLGKCIEIPTIIMENREIMFFLITLNAAVFSRAG
jgi:hypothetical protein